MSGNTIESYIEKKHYDVIYNAVLNYYNENKGHMDLHTFAVPFPKFIKLENITVKKIYFKDDMFSHETEFKMVVSADFLLKGDKSFEYEFDNRYRKFLITCNAIFKNGLSKFKVIDVDKYVSKPYEYKEGLSEFLIPFIDKKDLDKRATEFLKKYCQEALQTPMALPVKRILEKMEVSVFNAPLGKNVFGKAFFGPSVEKVYNDDNEVEEIQITEKTILVDPDVCFLRNFGSYNNTIIHECVHIEFHSKYFQVKKIIDENDNYIVSKTGSGSKTLNTKEKRAHSFMEWQASMLAPRILMPKQTTKVMYSQFLNEVNFLNIELSETVKLEYVIDKLADFFNVSKQAAKIRLIDLGYTAVTGINNYINKDKIPNYLIKEKTISREHTYIINFIDSVRQVISNRDLTELSSLGKITYVDGFLVVNSPDYVYINEEGTKSLTQYALENIHECAFTFKKQEVKSNSELYNYFHFMNFLCRPEKNNSYVSADYDEELENNKKVVKFANEVVEINDSRELLKKMNGDFHEDLLTVITQMGYVHSNGEPNYHNIQQLTLVQDKTIKSYVSGQNPNPQKEKLLAICAGLQFHTRVTYHLLARAGINVNTMKEVDFIYRSLIERHYNEGIEKWNEYLKEAKQPKLP